MVVSSHLERLGSFGPCHSECKKASKVQYIYVYILYMHTRLCFTLKARGHSEPLESSVGPDQLTSKEASCSGFRLFSSS